MAAALTIAFDRDAPPAALRRLAPAAVLERWLGVDRAPHRPHLVVLADDDDGGAGWSGAALVTSRPSTAYLKIVDAIGDVPSVVDAVVERARAEGLVQVKWEGWTVNDTDAAASGFSPLRAPLTADAGDPPGGFVRWLGDGPSTAGPPYYRQSTDFSCGAVVALLAQVQAGVVAAADIDQSAELALWRQATNFNACEPVGLGVAVRRAWPESAVRIALDVDRPVMVDYYPERDRGWRAVLQHASRDDAARLELPIDAERFTIDDLRAAVDDGEQVLLLITLDAMQGFGVPHWVLCHGVVPGAVVIEDPWTYTTAGESWVDAHLLAVADDALDAMAALEADRFRGAVRIGATS